MTRICVLSVACVFYFSASGCAAQDEDHALAQYKAYLSALRVGNVEEILKMSVPVSESVKAIQSEAVTTRILMERLRRATIAQFGPMKIDTKKDDPWLGIGEPWDEYLGDV